MNPRPRSQHAFTRFRFLSDSMRSVNPVRIPRSYRTITRLRTNEKNYFLRIDAAFDRAYRSRASFVRSVKKCRRGSRQPVRSQPSRPNDRMTLFGIHRSRRRVTIRVFGYTRGRSTRFHAFSQMPRVITQRKPGSLRFESSIRQVYMGYSTWMMIQTHWVRRQRPSEDIDDVRLSSRLPGERRRRSF